jgi:hypothetical protein
MHEELITIIIISSCSTWSTCQGSPIISLWETNCKIHADSKHEEMKGLLKEQNRFNASNWSHSALLILVTMLSLVVAFGCCFICYRFGPILMFAKKLKILNQMIPNNNHHHQPYNMSFNAPPPIYWADVTIQRNTFRTSNWER